MDDPTKKQILEDHKIIQENIMDILGGAPNHKVIEPAYLSPPLDTNKKLPLNSPDGLFQYYLKIRDALEFALIDGIIPFKRLPVEAPPYLANLSN